MPLRNGTVRYHTVPYHNVPYGKDYMYRIEPYLPRTALYGTVRYGRYRTLYRKLRLKRKTTQSKFFFGGLTVEHIVLNFHFEIMLYCS